MGVFNFTIAQEFDEWMIFGIDSSTSPLPKIPLGPCKQQSNSLRHQCPGETRIEEAYE